MHKAEVEAESLYEDFSLELPITPVDVCSHISTEGYPVSFKEVSFSSEFICGVSIGVNDKIQVLVNKNISNPGRKLFTAAHEIGHVILHIQPGIQSNFECTNDDINCKNKKTIKLEKEANHFSSNLLMPSSYIKPIIKSNDITWSLIQEIKEKCSTSLEATGRRLVTLSKEMCVLIIHKNGEMWTPIKSSSFPIYINPFQFPTQLISKSDKGILPNSLDHGDVEDFFYDSKFRGNLRYSSIMNDEFDRRMTLVHLDEFDEDDDEDEWDEPTF